MVRMHSLTHAHTHAHTYNTYIQHIQAVEEEAHRRHLAFKFSPGRDHADQSIQDYKVCACKCMYVQERACVRVCICVCVCVHVCVYVGVE